MTTSQILAVLLTVTALSGYINHRWLRMSASVMFMAVGLVGTGSLIALRHFGLTDFAPVVALMHGIDFGSLLLHGLLAILLFAVAFSILVQGMTAARVVRAFSEKSGTTSQEHYHV